MIDDGSFEEDDEIHRQVLDIFNSLDLYLLFYDWDPIIYSFIYV